MNRDTFESIAIALAIGGGVIIEVLELALKVAFVALVIYLGVTLL